MIHLASNGNKIPGSRWHGTDATTIYYPKVSTCITVTCVVPAGIAGVHLFRMTGEKTNGEDIATYGATATGATAMYLVGMLGEWEGPRNTTGMRYLAGSGGTMIAKLREATGYTGNVRVCDTTSRAKEGDLMIRATLSGATVQFAYNTDEESGVFTDLTGFTDVAGTVVTGGGSAWSFCTIL